MKLFLGISQSQDGFLHAFDAYASPNNSMPNNANVRMKIIKVITMFNKLVMSWRVSTGAVEVSKSFAFLLQKVLLRTFFANYALFMATHTNIL